MVKRDRADRLLVARGLFESRARAQAAIAAGLVTADGSLVRKPSDQISSAAAIAADPSHPYVSRGGVKLAAAIESFSLDIAGRVCLDVGSSAGGFRPGATRSARTTCTRSSATLRSSVSSACRARS